jgi:glutamate synthase (NADPH/NADH) small chain
MPKPPVGENPNTPWPYWPVVLKTTSSHEEGCDRKWLLDTRRIVGENGKVTAVEVEEVRWEEDPETKRMNLVHTGIVSTIKAELVLLAMGFVYPVQTLLEQLGLEKDARSNIKVNGSHATSVDGIFAAGDASTGASLVVRCIASGRDTAAEIHKYLQSKKS